MNREEMIKNLSMIRWNLDNAAQGIKEHRIEATLLELTAAKLRTSEIIESLYQEQQPK